MDVDASTALPCLWHWLYFLPGYRHSEAGEDGHPTKGGFLPPVPLPRRMWAGSQLQFEPSDPGGRRGAAHSHALPMSP
jgi:3-methylfumaryl-CoA hydratase